MIICSGINKNIGYASAIVVTHRTSPAKSDVVKEYRKASSFPDRAYVPGQGRGAGTCSKESESDIVYASAHVGVRKRLRSGTRQIWVQVKRKRFRPPRLSEQRPLQRLGFQHLAITPIGCSLMALKNCHRTSKQVFVPALGVTYHSLLQ